MNVILTSCGLETKRIEQAFTGMLQKSPSEIRVMFIPTAVNSPDAIDVLPKCVKDLTKCGIPRENIFVYDLYDAIEGRLIDTYDVIYLCGGSSSYLLRRINESKFRNQLLEFITAGGIVIGVSAGSVIFANNLSNNLGLLQCGLDVHCKDEVREKAGRYDKNRQERIKLGNTQAISFEQDSIIVFE